jgi:ribonucleotide reductase beta subunit family protein with ferritin-like domain
MSEDVDHFKNKLSPQMQHCVKTILAFFAASDGIVNINLAKRFKEDIPILEANYFYDYQIMMENVHAHMYSLLLDSIVPDAVERDQLLNAVTTMPMITKMSQYMFKCIDSDAPLSERLLRMACVEGIFFTGCFCIIYLFQQKGLMPGLGQSNELIARDEALHTMFALFMYMSMDSQFYLSNERVYEIVTEAVDIAIEFVHTLLPEGFAFMNANLMIPYVQCCADNLLTLIEVPALYKTKHDFKFMDQINMDNRGNFFERRVSEYGKVTKQSDRQDINRNF